MWLFYCKSKLKECEREKICELFSRYENRAEYEVPLCENLDQLRDFLNY